MMDTDAPLSGAQPDGEADMVLLTQIPDYDEDLEEAFIGPYLGDDQDETYDDEYEAETTAVLEGREPVASASSGRAVSGDTQSPLIALISRSAL